MRRIIMSKKITPEENAVNKVSDIITRLNTPLKRVNTSLISGNDEENRTTILTVSYKLWALLLEKKLVEYPELDLKKSEDAIMKDYFGYADIESEGWIPITNTEDLYNGKVINIKIADEIVEFNKELLPIKLKKAEYEDIYYKIFLGKQKLMSVRKQFKIDDELYFNAFRLFLMI